MRKRGTASSLSATHTSKRCAGRQCGDDVDKPHKGGAARLKELLKRKLLEEDGPAEQGGVGGYHRESTLCGQRGARPSKYTTVNSGEDTQGAHLWQALTALEQATTTVCAALHAPAATNTHPCPQPHHTNQTLQESRLRGWQQVPA